VLVGTSPAGAPPAATVVSTAAAGSEAYEGVLVQVENAVCTDPDLGFGEWEVNDGSGPGRVDDLSYDASPHSARHTPWPGRSRTSAAISR
jgi:hypothetical protein